MAGVLFLFVILLSVAVLGRLVARAFEPFPDPAARLGVYGLIGLGLLGTAIYLAGWLLPIGERFPRIVVALVPVVLLVLLLLEGRKGRPPKFGVMHLKLPKGPVPLLCLGGIFLAAALALTGVFTPSTRLDWDSLAYHLAVPKIWLAEGHIRPVSFIHHSRFPAAADSLFLLGLGFGGQSAAKGFMFAAYIFGIFAIFGLARHRYRGQAGWLAALGFAAVPMAIWEAGSAYIDLIHGLYAGIGLWLLADDSEDRPHPVVAALLIGLALGTKYTGLQAFGVAVVLVLIGSRRREILKFGAVALALGGFWYVKNWVEAGNPVYPFYYSIFGGVNWNEFAAKIYAEEQATFGMGRGPGALLGLAAVPGRFTNPAPLIGGGLPFVSLGAAGLAALVGWGLRTSIPRLERRALLACGLVLGLWLFTSQQSRYILALLPMLAILAGGLAATSRPWKVVVGINAAIGLFVVSRTLLPERLPYLSGDLTSEEYVGGFTRDDGSRSGGRLGFTAPANYLNEHVGKTGRVALYDELFGFLLDVPYVWAGPGHSTEIDYVTMKDGGDLVRTLGHLGVTHVYVNLALSSDPATLRFAGALGLVGPRQPYTNEETNALDVDPRTKWKRLLADAVNRQLLVQDATFGPRVVYRIAG